MQNLKYEKNIFKIKLKPNNAKIKQFNTHKLSTKSHKMWITFSFYGKLRWKIVIQK